MARNEEKHYGRLNRLLLQKERDEYLEHHPKRPRLDSLQTAEEIIQWIPSIKADMNFCLKQTQVTCYCDQKVKELMEKVNQFEREYKAFLRRARQLSSERLDIAPWTPRSYKSTTDDSALPANGEKKAFTPIFTPILESTAPTEEHQPCRFENLPLSDQPLQFNNLVSKSKEPTECLDKACCESSGNSGCCNHNLEADLNSLDAPVSKESSGLSHMSHFPEGTCMSKNTFLDHLNLRSQSVRCDGFPPESFSKPSVGIENNNIKHFNGDCNSFFCDTAYHNVTSKNILGLDYDSSSDEDNENT